MFSLFDDNPGSPRSGHCLTSHSLLIPHSSVQKCWRVYQGGGIPVYSFLHFWSSWEHYKSFLQKENMIYGNMHQALVSLTHCLCIWIDFCTLNANNDMKQVAGLLFVFFLFCFGVFTSVSILCCCSGEGHQETTSCWSTINAYSPSAC